MEQRATQALARLRVLSAIEVAVQEMLAAEAVVAIQGGAHYKELGDAAGISDSSAHTRWAALYKGERSHPKSRRRRGAAALAQVSTRHAALLDRMLDELRTYVSTPKSATPWADQVRYTLSYDSRVEFSESSREDGVTAFYLPTLQLVIRCYEATAASYGMVKARHQWNDDNALFEWEASFHPLDESRGGQTELSAFVRDLVAHHHGGSS